MSDEKKTQKRPIERVPLSPDSMTLLNVWAEQLKNQFRGMKVRLQDIVEWRLHQCASQLTQKELSDFKNRYWDEIAYATWAVREMKKARERGEVTGFDHYFAAVPVVKASRKAPTEKQQVNQEDIEPSGLDIPYSTKE